MFGISIILGFFVTMGGMSVYELKKQGKIKVSFSSIIIRILLASIVFSIGISIFKRLPDIAYDLTMFIENTIIKGD